MIQKAMVLMITMNLLGLDKMNLSTILCNGHHIKDERLSVHQIR